MNDQAKLIGNEEGWAFCPACASPLEIRVPDGDDHSRKVCSSCKRVFYENPKIIVGTIPMWKGKVLLCKRAIEPRYGFWTIPSGFMEKDETAEQGAARETWEEARARVQVERLHTLFSLPHVHQVYLLFLASMVDGSFEPGPESLECRLVDPRDIPWSEIAFRAVEFGLQRLGDLHEEGVHRGMYRRESKGAWTQAEPL